MNKKELTTGVFFLLGYAHQTRVNLAYSRQKVKSRNISNKLWRYHQERVFMLENRLFSIEQQIENFLDNNLILSNHGIYRV